MLDFKSFIRKFFYMLIYLRTNSKYNLSKKLNKDYINQKIIPIFNIVIK